MRLDTTEKRLQYRSIMVGNDYTRDPRSTEFAEVYIREMAGKFWAKGFIGSAGKHSFFCTFKTADQMEKYIVEFFANQQAVRDYKQGLQAQKKAFVHSLEVGQIMSGSWGYDQTNVELWEVTRLIGKSTAELRQVKTRTVPNSGGFMCEHVTPIAGEYYGEAKTCRVQEGNRCRVHNCCTVSPCNENDSHYSSWYA